MNRTENGQIFTALFLIVAVTSLLYGHTLDVPFYLDDYNALVNHYVLRDLAASLDRIFTPRGITNLTFAVNFHLSGWAIPPLHLTNIAIHAASGCLAYLLLRRWFAQRWFPLLGALLFVAHPLQTQAVTYLVQRAASLATLFFLLAVWLHLRARDALAAGHRRTARAFLFPQLTAAAVFALAVLAKTNTATLPLVLIVHDRLFPQGIVRSRRQTLLDYLPYAAAPLFGIVEYLHALDATALHSPLASLHGNDAVHYLATQFSVIWIYIRLLILPYGQALEHNYPIVARLLSGQTLLALSGFLALAWLAWRLRRTRPLTTFGVAWFFLGLAIESSIVPLDTMFEHRLYLPMFGVVLIVLDLLTVRLTTQQARTLLIVAVIVCALLTWQRNRLWNDPIAFFEDNQTIAPDSERVCLILANHYKKAGRLADARRQFERMRRIVPPDPNPYHQEIILFYAEQGEYEQAWTLVEEGLRLRPLDPETYKSGALYWMQRRQPQAALEFMLKGIAAAPQNGKMHDLLGELALDQGDAQLAEVAFRESIRLGTATPSTYRNLAEALYRRGRMNEALSQLRIALAGAPGRPDIYEGIGRVAVALGDKKMTDWAAERLAGIDHESWRRLQQVVEAIPTEKIR